MGWTNVAYLWRWLHADLSGPTCRAPVFEPCAEGAGECTDATPFMRGYRVLCVWHLAAFTLRCEPCA